MSYHFGNIIAVFLALAIVTNLIRCNTVPWEETSDYISAVGEYQCTGRKLVTTFSGGMGLQNQIVTIAKTILVASLTRRNACITNFKSDFRGTPDTFISQILDLEKVNQLFAQSFPQFNATKIREARSYTATCLRLTGAGAPPGSRRCFPGDSSDGMIDIRSRDSNYKDIVSFLQLPDIDRIESVVLSPGMPFLFTVTTPEIAPIYQGIKEVLVFQKIFYDVVDYVKHKEGICLEQTCTGYEIYAAVHLRLESDILSNRWRSKVVDPYTPEERVFPSQEALGYCIATDFLTFLRTSLPVLPPVYSDSNKDRITEIHQHSGGTTGSMKHQHQKHKATVHRHHQSLLHSAGIPSHVHISSDLKTADQRQQLFFC